MAAGQQGRGSAAAEGGAAAPPFCLPSGSVIKNERGKPPSFERVPFPRVVIREIFDAVQFNPFCVDMRPFGKSCAVRSSVTFPAEGYEIFREIRATLPAGNAVMDLKP